MSQRPQNLQPLSVGNVVSAGVRLYRSHFKTYFDLAVTASLWSLVPVYGWAKYYMIAGLISRLAFGELVERPESVESVRSQLKPKLWDFLVTALLIGLIVGAVVIGFYIIGIIVGLIAGGLFLGLANVLGQQNIIAAIFIILVIILVILGFIAAATWISARFLISELPLAIEEGMTSSNTINRSWQLTKGYAIRIQLIILVAFLVMLPLQIPIQAISFTLQLRPPENPFALLILFLLLIVLGLASNAIILPFWQTIKAVLYYDLRSRREGLGLEIRDRKL